MGDYNPFANKTRKEYTLVPRGQYQGELLEVKAVKGKDKEGKEVDKIRFVFGVEVNGQPQRVFKTVYPGTTTTSHFAMTIRAIAPDLFDEKLLEDDDAIWQFTQSLVGRQVTFFVTINGQWNNIEALAPVLAVQPRQAIQQTPIAQDDIPF